MSDVFISYARSTAKQAQQVAAALRAHGYSVWIDDDLPAHRTYSRVIEEQMTAAKAAVVIWSADAARSEWVLSEANRAREDRKLVQVATDKARLPMPFDTIQCADLAGWTGDAAAHEWRKVVASIADLVGADGSASPSRPTAVAAAAKPTEPLLAVLAFDNLSGDPEMAYFSDGVSEEIQQTVARGTDLKVIGRNSSFQFRGADKSARHVAAELSATHILDGSVRRSGPKVRISAQLIECAGQTTLWSDRFDRDLSDVFALQDEIAGAVAAALKVAFAPPAAADAVDPSTYDLFLRAQARGLVAVDPEKLVQTVRMLERVVAAAPKLARAWSALAACRAGLVRFHGEAARRYGISRESGRDAAETALNLDPGLGPAYWALSLLEVWAHYEERDALLSKALDLAPNDPETLAFVAFFLSVGGRRREARAYIEQAHDLDPLDIDVAILWLQMRYDRDLWESHCARWPDNDNTAYLAIYHAAMNGDWEGYDAFVAASRLRITTDPNFRGLVWFTRNLRNPYRQAIARGLEQARQELSRTGTVPVNTLTSLSQLGLTEEVFDLIDQASFAHVFDEAAPGPAGITSPGIMFMPANMAMIRDIRFVGLCAKLGLCAYWVKTDRWPDCAAEVAYDFQAEARRLAGAAA
jgi:TolB-like protein